jgi:mannose-6-phosphate isomerase-like protein (cupin superfamily)
VTDPTSLPVNALDLAQHIAAAHAHASLGRTNDHEVVLAVNFQPYPWHEHPDSDELFMVLEGTLVVEHEDGTSVVLSAMDTWVVPAGTVHRTTPRGRCVNIVVERADTVTRFIDGGADG